MFAGIIEAVGRVASVQPRRGCTRLGVQLDWPAGEVKPGASVAINGVCLTLVSQNGRVGEFDVIPETLRRSNLGSLRPGDSVNLERSLRVGDRVDGHFVQGHVDGLGKVDAVERSAGEVRLWTRIEPALRPLIVPKGSIAIDGVSLTVAEVAERRFCVALIPTTLMHTTLGTRKVGDRVNLETDILARLVVDRLEAYRAAAGTSGGLTEARLRESGFGP